MVKVLGHVPLLQPIEHCRYQLCQTILQTLTHIQTQLQTQLQRPAMETAYLVPITLFVCIAYTIKAVVDAYARRKMIESHGSEELLRTLLAGENARTRLSSLYWACVLIALALGFGLIDVLGIDRVTPGSIALLLGSTGVGNLAYHLLAAKIK
jgi:putative exporter of polyketide antibiotics